MKISDGWKTTPEGKKVKVYLIRYQDKSKHNSSGKPVHRQETFEKKKHAEARLLILQNEIASGFHIAKRDVKTFGEAANEYMRHVEDKLKDGRIFGARHKTISRTVGKYAIGFAGALPLNDLSAADVEAFYRYLIKEKGVQPVSALRYVNDFKLVLDYALKRKWLKQNVAVDAMSELRNLKVPAIAQFSSDEVKHLLKVSIVRAPNAKYRAHLMLNIFVNAAAFCGLRWGEIAGLTKKDIDLDRCQIHVRHNLSYYDGLKAPKTKAGVRDIPMPLHLRDMLKEWMEKHHVSNKDDLVMIGRIEGGALYSGSFHNHLWRPLMRRAGFEGRGFHFHALRHFAASWWLANDIPMTDVAKLMGHSQVHMTMSIYAHALSKTSVVQGAIERMSTALLPAPETAAQLPHPTVFAPLLRSVSQVIKNA